MTDVLIIRKNRTMKSKRINNKKDEFNFEDGRYYIQPDKVIFKQVLFWAKPFLLYFEGIPIPIGIEEIKSNVDTNNKKELTAEELKNAKTEILINSRSIHDLVSTDVLSVLTKKTLSNFELLLLGLVILTFLVSIAGVNV